MAKLGHYPAFGSDAFLDFGRTSLDACPALQRFFAAQLYELQADFFVARGITDKVRTRLAILQLGSSRELQSASYVHMRANTILLIVLLGGSQILVTGCNSKPPNPDQVREKTAQATSELKENAEAVAQGVREGLTRPSSDRPLDLNSASKSQLLSLPGITDDAADRIIAARPYSNTHELLNKRIISREEFDEIANRITVQK